MGVATCRPWYGACGWWSGCGDTLPDELACLTSPLEPADAGRLRGELASGLPLEELPCLAGGGDAPAGAPDGSPSTVGLDGGLKPGRHRIEGRRVGDTLVAVLPTSMIGPLDRHAATWLLRFFLGLSQRDISSTSTLAHRGA